MSKTKRILILIAVYMLGIATPYATQYALTVIGHHISGREEFSRQTSPDGVLDAVVIQVNPGAFSSYFYFLYLVPKGAKADKILGDPAIVQTSEGDPLIINWEKPHFLSVNSGNSHIQFFGNLWDSNRVPDYYVELSLAESGKHYLQQNGKLRAEQ